MTPSEVTAALIRQGKTRAEAQYLALTSRQIYNSFAHIIFLIGPDGERRGVVCVNT